MKISWSKRHQNHHIHHPSPPMLPPPSSSIAPPFPSLPPPPPHPTYSLLAASTTPPPFRNPYPLLTLPPPNYLPPSNLNYHFNFSQSSYDRVGIGLCSHLHRPLSTVLYVDYQNAKKITNDINVHKDTIRSPKPKGQKKIIKNSKKAHYIF
ncbi:hypothetical protein H5410_038442 [Solanum commersonii]|uniref:Uncharacterized protein n=1 Tax=Solanum commersonii TaxID=4109 RepID=A0A9J5YAP4_SOLCO|nr:hypothetical protein H5410_038442 [Solanum commersonii]